MIHTLLHGLWQAGYHFLLAIGMAAIMLVAYESNHRRKD